MLNSAQNQFDAFRDAPFAGLEQKVIVGCIAPECTGVVTAVFASAFVYIGNHTACRGFGYLFAKHNTACCPFRIRGNEQVECIGSVLENDIGQASYDDTGTFLCQFLNDRSFGQEQFILRCYGTGCEMGVFIKQIIDKTIFNRLNPSRSPTICMISVS